MIKKARAHPRLYEMKDVFVGHSEIMAISTPKFKEKAIFLFDQDDQLRPEVQHYHKMVRNFKSKKSCVIVIKEPHLKPGYLSHEYHQLKRKFKDIDEYQVCFYNPHLGLIPNEISDIFPAAHHEISRFNFDPKKFFEFEKTWAKFFQNNKFTEIYFDKTDEFLKPFIKNLPKQIRKKSV